MKLRKICSETGNRQKEILLEGQKSESKGVAHKCGQNNKNRIRNEVES